MSNASESIALQYAMAMEALNRGKIDEVWADVIVNAKAVPFSAVGDGATDDTQALQKAIDYAVSKGKKDIWLPPGTYKYTTLTNTSAVTFYGDNATLSGTTVLNVSSFDAMRRRLDNLIAGAGSSNSEIVDGRLPVIGTAYPTLKARMDADRHAVDARIDNLVISSTGDGAPELRDARIPAFGSAFPTLKARLDAEKLAIDGRVDGLVTSKANQTQVDSLQSTIGVFQAGQLSGLTGADALALLAIGVDTNGNTYATPTDRIKAIESAVNIKGKNLKGTLVINNNTIRIPFNVTKGVKTSITFTYSISATPTHMYLSTQSSPDGGTTFVYEQQYLQDFTSNISTQQSFEFIPLKDATYITFNLTNVAWTGTLTYEFKGSGTDASIGTKDLLFDGDLNFTYKQPVDLGFVKKGDLIKIELWSYVGPAYRISYMETTSTYQQIFMNGSTGIYTYSSQFASLYSFRYLLIETSGSGVSYSGHLRVTRINDDSVYAYQNNRSYLKEKSESFKMASLGDSITSDQVTGLGTAVPSYLKWANVGNFAIGSAVCADKSDTTDNLTTPANAFASINVLSNQVKRLLQNTTALGAQVTWTVEGTAYSISTSVGTGLGNTTQIPEIIYIAIGTNDSVYTDDVDTILEQPYSALTRQTIGSALRWAIQTLQTVYPYAQIFVNSPMQTQQTGNQFAWNNQKTKRGIIKKVCEAMAVEFIDSYAESGFNRYNATFYATEVGIHPSKYIGKPIMVRYLANRLKNSAIKKYMLEYTQD